MAEVAGLVIGAVSLAGLFDSTISCFERVQVGREFGESFPRYRNDLQVLELRLGRWSNAVNQLSEAKDPSIDEAKSPLVEEILNDLKGCLVKAERQSKNFGTVAPPSKADMTKVLHSESLAKAMHTITLKRLRMKQFRNQTKWAIYGEKDFNRLVANIESEVENLEKIFPIANLTDLLAKMRVEDAEDLGKDSTIDDNDLAMVKESAKAHDPLLENPVKEVINQRAAGHRYLRNIVDTGANLAAGNYVASDYNGPLKDWAHDYSENHVSSTANVTFGDHYGGKGFWEMAHERRRIELEEARLKAATDAKKVE